MSFPNYPEKHRYPSILTAEAHADHRARLGQTARVKPHGVLFCPDRGLLHRMRWRIPVRRVGAMNAEVYAVKKTKGRVVVLTGFGGSPVIMALAEELAVAGVTNMILVGSAGRLQPGLPPGAIVVCNRAIRDEGASHHYLPSAKYADADSLLVNELVQAIRRRVPCIVGTTWTTDAPYRETREEVIQYQGEGAQVVEMESAGLFTIGQVRDVRTASVVIGTDNLASLRWQPPTSAAAIRHSQGVAYAAAIEVLSQS